MLTDPSTGRPHGRGRFLALAGTALAAAAITPAAADAAFTTAPCGGAAIAGNGASFQAGAQQGFIANFRSADFCGSDGPAVTYTANGSGNGRKSFGDGPSGARSPTSRYTATDEAPDAAQTLRMEKGPHTDGVDNTAADDGDLHVIPVAVGANAIVVNFPEGCTPPAAALVDAAKSTKRIKLSPAALEPVFAADATADTWGELLPGISGTPSDTQMTGAGITACTDVPIRRVVRQDSSGTTFVQKDWLHRVNGARGWPAPLGNTAWPNPVGGTESATQCPVEHNLCRNTGPGNGPLLDKLTGTDGGIGYSDVSTARQRGFEISSLGDDTFWIPVVQDNGTAYEPTSDPNAWQTNVGTRGSNCASTTFSNVPATTLGDWSPVSGTLAPSGTAYPICTLTYAMAWDDYAPVYGVSAEEEAKARTAKDFLASAVSSLGQAQLEPRDYSKLPIALRNLAQAGVEAIGYNKTASGGGGGTTPPATTPPATTPPATTPPVLAPPSNAFTITSARAKGTRILLSLQLPGAGSVVAAATTKVRGRTVKVGTVKATVTRAGTVKLTIKPSKAALKALRKHSLKVRVKVTFKPAGGSAKSATKSVSLKKLKKKARRK